MDLEDYRSASRDQWEGSAENWGDRAQDLQRLVAPVSEWLIDAVKPQPGQTILELAAGAGETGFLIAEMVRPGGTLISTDFAEGMVEVAKARSAELGLDNVEHRQMDAESMKLDTASVDGVICRWGYMLMADPGAALRETRRVLRPGGRVALAAWGPPPENPWVSIPGSEVRERTGAPPLDPEAPGMFAFAPPGRVERELGDAGFTDIRVEPLALTFTYPSFDAWWEVNRALGRPLAEAVDAMEPAARDDLVLTLRERMSGFANADGGLEIPAKPLMASASA